LLFTADSLYLVGSPHFFDMKQTTLCLLSSIFISSIASADIVRTIDGAELTGTITLIDKGIIHLDTAYYTKMTHSWE